MSFSWLLLGSQLSETSQNGLILLRPLNFFEMAEGARPLVAEKRRSSATLHWFVGDMSTGERGGDLGGLRGSRGADLSCGTGELFALPKKCNGSTCVWRLCEAHGQGKSQDNEFSCESTSLNTHAPETERHSQYARVFSSLREPGGRDFVPSTPGC